MKAVCPTPTTVKACSSLLILILSEAILGEVGWSGVLLAPEQGVRVEDPVLQQVPDHVTKQYTIYRNKRWKAEQSRTKLLKAPQNEQ
jgi:hypothetical protein